ncbi:MAG: hypothetical protein HYU36_08250 [Planctomycetes bacterium]|nr:hypothetical protein [Planctomycetota bacterium]
MTRLLRRSILPVFVFHGVGLAHYVYLGFFPDEDSAQSRWVANPSPTTSWWTRYIETQGYWLGLSYAMSLTFAVIALRRYRERRFCQARNLAVGGITLSGFLAVAGCYLVGCCGSPMLIVYLNCFGAAFIPLAKPLIAGVTALSLALAWWWMLCAERKTLRVGQTPPRASCCG